MHNASHSRTASPNSSLTGVTPRAQGQAMDSAPKKPRYGRRAGRQATGHRAWRNAALHHDWQPRLLFVFEPVTCLSTRALRSGGLGCDGKYDEGFSQFMPNTAAWYVG